MEELLSPVIKAHPSRKRKIARPDQVLRNPESLEALLHANRNNASRISSIKDLRMRRVFTPDVNLVLEEDDDDDYHDTETEGGKKLLKASESCRLDCKSERKTALNSHRRRRVFKTSSSFSYRRLFPHMMDILNDSPNVPIIEIVDAVAPCKLPRLDGVKSQKMSFADYSCTAKVKCAVSQLNGTTIPSQNKSVAQDEMSRMAEITTPPQQKVFESDVDRLDASVVKECVQMTPPSPAISFHTENGHGGDQPMEKKQKQIKASEKSSSDILSRSLSRKHDANSINRSVLKPCSRLRLFDNPKSLSYRRMLPFLINAFQDNPCDSRITQQPMPQVNLKKYTDGENYTNGITTGNTCEKQLTADQTQNFLSSVVSVPPESNNNNNTIFSMSQPSPTKYSSNGDLHVVTPESPPEPMMPQIDLHTDKMPQSLSDHRKFEFCFDGNRKALQPVQSSINNDILNKQSTSEEPAPVGEQNNTLDKGIELQNNNEEPTDTFDLKQCSFRNKSDADMVSPANVSFRGILKRNPQGCRGLCNCLKCASFRLHADRAFEFSRNQMHDAEEVVSCLMKELANLRFLLEKSITCDNDLGAIQLNPVLIKEACYKSLAAETQAKECLSHLNYDLDIHCRTPNILKPKVTFASNIQERAILVLDPLASIEKKG